MKKLPHIVPMGRYELEDCATQAKKLLEANDVSGLRTFLKGIGVLRGIQAVLTYELPELKDFGAMRPVLASIRTPEMVHSLGVVAPLFLTQDKAMGDTIIESMHAARGMYPKTDLIFFPEKTLETVQALVAYAPQLPGIKNRVGKLPWELMDGLLVRSFLMEAATKLVAQKETAMIESTRGMMRLSVQNMTV